MSAQQQLNFSHSTGARIFGVFAACTQTAGCPAHGGLRSLISGKNTHDDMRKPECVDADCSLQVAPAVPASLQDAFVDAGVARAFSSHFRLRVGTESPSRLCFFLSRESKSLDTHPEFRSWGHNASSWTHLWHRTTPTACKHLDPGT